GRRGGGGGGGGGLNGGEIGWRRRRMAKGFQGFNARRSEAGPLATVPVAVRVGDGVIVVVARGGVRTPFRGALVGGHQHAVALEFGLEQGRVDPGRAVVKDGEGGVDGPEQVHVEFVLAFARGDQ